MFNVFLLINQNLVDVINVIITVLLAIVAILNLILVFNQKKISKNNFKTNYDLTTLSNHPIISIENVGGYKEVGVFKDVGIENYIHINIKIRNIGNSFAQNIYAILEFYDIKSKKILFPKPFCEKINIIEYDKEMTIGYIIETEYLEGFLKPITDINGVFSIDLVDDKLLLPKIEFNAYYKNIYQRHFKLEFSLPVISISSKSTHQYTIPDRGEAKQYKLEFVSNIIGTYETRFIDKKDYEKIETDYIKNSLLK